MTNIETTIQNLVNEDYAAALESFNSVRMQHDRIDHTREIFAAACPTLNALCAAMNGLEAELEEDEELQDYFDTTSLPIYDGQDEAWLDDAWSWDARRALVPENPRTGASEWTIVPRWDLDDEDND